MTTVATASTACTVCRRGRYFNLTITTDPATGEITTTTPSCLQCPLGSVSPGGPFFTANNSGPVCSPCPGASTTNRTGSAHCTSTCYSLGLPPALELGFWNESCLSTPIGGNCAARCPAGYQPGSSSAPPPPPSACTIDPARGLVWSQPAGSCEKAWRWDISCLTTPLSGSCTATCSAGYQPGSSGPPVSTCSFDPARGLVWGAPVGSCERVPPLDCEGRPAALQNGAWSCGGTTPDGQTCQGTCNQLFTVSGTLSARCTNGVWARLRAPA
ncbi:hypothetical protein OEZ86_013172 [Tetradesmus obliquus]|nr:hypothetical protein OEZ86_013172 [Tetradesmus obliquus]